MPLYQSNNVKVQVYCPFDNADEMRLAIGEAGGGFIGNYSNCAFVSSGTGYFLPLDGSKPAIGSQGAIAQVKEVKIEFICTQENLGSVIAAIESNHPYEEVAMDILPLLDYKSQ